MRFALKCALVLVLIPSLAYGAMTDSKAATTAFKIWGAISRIAMFHDWTAGNWTKQVGFVSPGCKDDFTIVGEGFNTWDAAFAAIPSDQGIGGTFTGQEGITITESDVGPDVIIGDVTSIQVLLDGMNFGLPVLVGNVPWTVTVPWDTRLWANGPHVACVSAIHADGTYSRTRATVLFVNN